MKIVAYLVAGLVAVGVMVALIATPEPSASPDLSAASATTVAAEPALLAEAGTLTLEVPSMHCQFACFPRVKETLEKTDAVSEVVLAEQPDPNALTNKQVIVKYEEGFDVTAALASLQKEGFSDATQVQ